MKRIFFSILAIGLIIITVSFQSQKQVGIGNATRGKKVYDKECITCHQADGGGVPRLNPPLSECSWVVGDKNRIIAIVLNGMTDRVEIDGEYYSNSMASHKHLSDQQIADVLTYIRTSFGNKASAITAQEVAAVRKPKKK